MNKKLCFAMYIWSLDRWTFGISIGRVIGDWAIQLWLGPCSFEISLENKDD